MTWFNAISFVLPTIWLILLGGHGVVAQASSRQQTTPSLRRPPSHSRQLASGGSDSSSGLNPTFVELISSTGRICGGVLIDTNLVLTAAICTYSSDGTSRADATNSLVYVKSEDTAATKQGITRNWAAYVAHPNYRYGSELDNLAVVLIAGQVKSIEFSEINSCSWVPCDGSQVVSAGYGSGSSTAGEGTLQDVSFTTTATTSCPSEEYRNRVLCVESATSDMCEGDEGSPLFLDGEDDSAVVGIYSHGGACDGTIGSPKFMRTSGYTDFLVEAKCALNSNYCSGAIDFAPRAWSRQFSNALYSFTAYFQP